MSQVPRLPRKTTWPHLLTRRKRHVFATFPIGTATFTLRSVKINVFLRVFFWTDCKNDVSREASVDFHDMSQNAMPATEFAPSHSADNAIRKKHAARDVESAAPVTQNEIRGVQSAAPATKNATHLLQMLRKYCACHTKRLLTRLGTCWNVTKYHACHAKWSYVTLESSKSNPFCRTSYRHGHTALTRTGANGCGRLRTVADGCERKRNVRRTQLYPHTPRVKREPLLRIRELGFQVLRQAHIPSVQPRKVRGIASQSDEPLRDTELSLGFAHCGHKTYRM